jgi:hypothetical protein
MPPFYSPLVTSSSSPHLCLVQLYLCSSNSQRLTNGPQYLHLPLVCFELESRDVEMGFFFVSDTAFDLLPVTALWSLRQTCHLRAFHTGQFPVRGLVAWSGRLQASAGYCHIQQLFQPLFEGVLWA